MGMLVLLCFVVVGGGVASVVVTMSILDVVPVGMLTLILMSL